MLYTLWDIETNNLVAEYGGRREVLSLVLRGVDSNGPHDADCLALDVEDEHGDVSTVASGAELVELARRELLSSRLAG